MTKSELIARLSDQHVRIQAKVVKDAVKEILEHMATTLARGARIEIRGFGSFSLHYRAPRIGRNPKTGDKVKLEGKYVPHFKPGKKLRDRANVYD
ncbi:MAG: integration host factor subunit beta [Sodalis sp. Fse]|nr:MAG: integration host factor subunit beta [Sodalis sp. Fse]UVK79361.1 MAG: integration host factor subunit beta [Sodalis sp. Ffu]